MTLNTEEILMNYFLTSYLHFFSYVGLKVEPQNTRKGPHSLRFLGIGVPTAPDGGSPTSNYTFLTHHTTQIK